MSASRAVPSDPGARLSQAVLRPTSGNAFEKTFQQLATSIRLGVFADGEQLPPERELAERLGVSRVTLREAIAALRESGMVVTRRGRTGGSVVTYAGPRFPTATDTGPSTANDTGVGQLGRGADLVDVLSFRRIVEPGAAYLAACVDLTAEQGRWLRAAEADVRSHAADAAAHRVADARLHLAIASLCGSAMLVEAVTRAQAALHELLTAIPVLRRNIDNSSTDHAQIVTAILERRPDDARRVMEKHCDATAAVLHGLLG